MPGFSSQVFGGRRVVRGRNLPSTTYPNPSTMNPGPLTDNDDPCTNHTLHASSQLQPGHYPWPLGHLIPWAVDPLGPVDPLGLARNDPTPHTPRVTRPLYVGRRGGFIAGPRVSTPRLWRPEARSRQQHHRARPVPIRSLFIQSLRDGAVASVRVFLPIPFHTLHERTSTPASSRPQHTAARDSHERDV